MNKKETITMTAETLKKLINEYLIPGLMARVSEELSPIENRIEQLESKIDMWEKVIKKNLKEMFE